MRKVVVRVVTMTGDITGVAAACANGARTVAPVVAAGAYVAFNGYKPLLWLLVAASVLAALSARLANRRPKPSTSV